MDESRFGLLTRLARRITLPGIKPIGRCQFQRDSFYLYGVAEVSSGESYFRAACHLNTAQFQQFVTEFLALYPDDYHLWLLDNSRTHQLQALAVADRLHLLFIPPYSPDFNPIERLWQHLKAPLAGVVHELLFALQAQLATLIDCLDSSVVASLVSPSWLVAAALNAGLPF